MDWFTFYIESTKFHLWTYIWLHWAWRLGSHSKHTAHKTPFQRKKLKRSLDSSAKSPHSGANKSKGQWLQKVRCLFVFCIKKKSCDRHALDDFVMLLVPQAPPISQLFFALTWYSAGSHRPCFSYLSLIPGRKSKRVLVSSVPALQSFPKTLSNAFAAHWPSLSIKKAENKDRCNVFSWALLLQTILGLYKWRRAREWLLVRQLVASATRHVEILKIGNSGVITI